MSPAKPFTDRESRNVIIGISFLGFLLMFLLFGIPETYSLLFAGKSTELLFEVVATYLGFGIFFIFMVRYFLLYQRALLFLSLAFLTACLGDIVRSFSFSSIQLSPAEFAVIRDISVGATKVVFVALLAFSAFTFEKITPRENLVKEGIKYGSIAVSIALASTLLPIFIFPHYLSENLSKANQALCQTCDLFIGAALIIGSLAAAVKFYADFMRKKNQLLLWFTLGLLLSIVNDFYLLPLRSVLDITLAFSLVFKILTYTTFGIGMIDDYVRYLLREKEIASSLEKLVVKRTEELQRKNKELEERTKESLEASRLKSELLANMSHELRTPMNAIIGFTNRVIKKCNEMLPERQLRNLKTVERNAHHLLSLINSILDVSKVEAGRMEVLVEPFQLKEIIAEVIDMSSSLTSDKPLKLLYECADDIYINSDRTKVKQMLINLVGNSIKFTENGGIKITAQRAKYLSGMGDTSGRVGDVFGKSMLPEKKTKMAYVDIAVSDTGIGIKEENLKYIFDEFRQVDGSLTRKTGGTGLGLAIVKKFSVLLGGDVKVESVYKKGTCFTITIPVDSTFAERTKSDITQEKLGKFRKHILCITESPKVVDLMRKHVNRDGFGLAYARTQREGLKLAKEDKPLAIAVDMMLKESSFSQTVQEIKSDIMVTNVPIIGFAFDQDCQHSYLLALVDYMAKPILQQDLMVNIYKNAVYKPVKTILIIDDDQQVHDEIANVLKNEPYALLKAFNGSEGLSMCRKQKPDLIFLDLVMGGMDGFEFLDELRADEELRNISIVILTAKDLDVGEERMLQSKVELLLKKSTQPADAILFNLINAANTI
ncbi:MAG: response regulator [Candidatus Omnitrophica bacterium]|nr:response regulator [Candidatus Omnitrophota bacterium]